MMQIDSPFAATKMMAPTSALPGSLDSSAGGLATTPSSSAPFAGLLQDAVTNLKTLESQASGAVEGLVSGRGVDIHTAMIATEKSDLAFQMALAVRGKAVSAYQTMMGVQF